MHWLITAVVNAIMDYHDYAITLASYHDYAITLASYHDYAIRLFS